METILVRPRDGRQTREVEFFLRKTDVPFRKGAAAADIPERSLSDLRTLHLHVERANRELSAVPDGLLPDMPMLLALERRLRDAAYPRRRREFTAAEMESLRESYVGVDTEGWDDDGLDVYEGYYSPAR